MANQNATSGGIGFLGVLAIVFITLKLTGLIDWSWVWVLAPLWFPAALVLVVLVIGFIMYMLFQRGRK